MSLRRRFASIFAIALGLQLAPSLASSALAAHAKKKPVASAQASGGKLDHGDKRRQLSVGAPNNGRLAGASRLKPSRHLRTRTGAHTWALGLLAKALHHAAEEVAKKHKGSVMLVGDLSGRTGGHLDGHNSHQSGRDADVAFYVMNAKGKPLATSRFVAFDAAGKGRDMPSAYFDDARNWTMVEALLKDEKAGVKYLFITNPLKARLLAYATKKHVAKDLMLRAAQVMMSPADADVHDDHFHVRLTCPDAMRDVCVEESTAHVPAPAAEAAAPAEAAPADDKPASEEPADAVAE